MRENIPRIMIAGATSNSGKTTVTLGLLTALMRRGLKPASFKCGPDFVDPLFHTEVVGTQSSNLDLYMMDVNTVRSLLLRNAVDSDIAVLEGVMGYYDGLAGCSPEASSYDVSQKTQTPTLLVISAKGMSVSMAAQVKGYAMFRDSNIAGVLLNQLSPKLYPEIKRLIEEETQVPVLGYIPYRKELAIESRHLGLVSVEEVERLQQKLHTLAEVLEEYVDIDQILRIAQSARPLRADNVPLPSRDSTSVRIAIAKDAAFCFYYADGMHVLKQLGAELVEFSPLSDTVLPPKIDGLLLGGGYPELHAQKLSSNESMRVQIRRLIMQGIPCIAEGGGFMYLHQQLEGIDGQDYPMVGMIPASSYRENRLKQFGYIEMTARTDTMLHKKGECVRAHEFHYWQSEAPGKSYRAQKPLRSTNWSAVHSSQNVWAGFPHIHFAADTRAAQRFVAVCKQYQEACIDS